MAVSISIGMGTPQATQSNALTINDNDDGTSTITNMPDAPGLNLTDNGNGTGTVSLLRSAYAFSGQPYSFSAEPFTY